MPQWLRIYQVSWLLPRKKLALMKTAPILLRPLCERVPWAFCLFLGRFIEP